MSKLLIFQLFNLIIQIINVTALSENYPNISIIISFISLGISLSVAGAVAGAVAVAVEETVRRKIKICSKCKQEVL